MNNICQLCPHKCSLSVGEYGKCKVRKFDGNNFVLDYYGKITTIAVEPIEKKPIYHFKPNSKVLSVGGFSCNMSCDFCQNYLISQANKINKYKTLMPDDVISLAKEKECSGICVTFNEPTIYYEYLFDLAKEAHNNGLFFIIKTNGYLCEDPWFSLLSVVDAVNIDYKGNEWYYEKVAGISSNTYPTILDNIKKALTQTHVEISIPIHYDYKLEDYNDVFNILEEKKETPIHLLKIFSVNKNFDPIVQDDVIFDMRNELLKTFPFVYVQNIFSQKGKDARKTYDPITKEVLINREALKSEILVGEDDNNIEKYFTM
jgi:pyruvate formate lyase activating enzyme